MANETLRFPLLLVSCWRARTPGRHFFSRGGHHKGVMLRAPKWLAAALLILLANTNMINIERQCLPRGFTVFAIQCNLFNQLYCIQQRHLCDNTCRLPIKHFNLNCTVSMAWPKTGLDWDKNRPCNFGSDHHSWSQHTPLCFSYCKCATV